MDRVGIVVLNYNNYGETIKCIDSILKQVNVEMVVAIVDNGSTNESVAVLSEYIKSSDIIHLIENEENLGYARGNNVGIAFLRDNGCSYIIVCNSDVVFSSENIIEAMQKNTLPGVGVAIPIIKNMNGSVEMRAQYKRKYFCLRVIKELLKMIFYCSSVKQSMGIEATNSMEELSPGVCDEYCAITGSIFLLSPSFFDSYTGLFAGTFLYVEELATLLLVYKAGLKCAIINTDDVYHKGAASTDLSLKSGTKKKKKMIARSARKVLVLAITPYSILRKKQGI